MIVNDWNTQSDGSECKHQSDLCVLNHIHKHDHWFGFASSLHWFAMMMLLDSHLTGLDCRFQCELHWCLCMQLFGTQLCVRILLVALSRRARGVFLDFYVAGKTDDCK